MSYICYFALGVSLDRILFYTVADTKVKTFFEKRLMRSLVQMRSRGDIVLCGHCGTIINKSPLVHFAQAHGIYRYHCRYCKFGQVSIDPLIQHLAKEHPNKRCCIVSRTKSYAKVRSGGAV